LTKLNSAEISIGVVRVKRNIKSAVAGSENRKIRSSVAVKIKRFVSGCPGANIYNRSNKKQRQ
jgi:hypothetical protein